MSRHDTEQADIDGLLATHESRKQAEALINRHRLPTGEPGGAFNVLGLLIAVVVLLVLYNVPALARAAAAWWLA